MFSDIKANTTDTLQVVAPKATMISFHTCMSCGKVGRVPYRSVMMHTEHPTYMMIFCEDQKCRQNAYNGLYIAMTQYQMAFPIRCWTSDKITCNVKRSSGEVESDWTATHLIFNEEGIGHVYVCSFSKGVEKAVPFDTFINLNPDLKEKLEEIAKMMIDIIFSKFDGLI